MEYLFFIPLLSAVPCALLGAIALARGPRRPANIGLAAGMLSVAAVEAGWAILMGAPSFGRFGARTFAAGQAFLPAAWLIFSIAFARREPVQELRKRPFTLLGASAASLTFAALGVSTDLITPRGDPFSPAGPLLEISAPGKYFYIYIVIGLSLGLVHLENTLRSAKGRDRTRIKYVIIGAGSILASYIYLSSQALLFRAVSAQTLLLASIVALASAFAMLASIAKNRLLEVDIFVSRYVLYNSFTALGVGVYLIAVGVVTEAINYFQFPFSYFLSTLFVFSSVVVLFALFFSETLKRKTEVFVTRHFYRHKHEFKDRWMETIGKMGAKAAVAEVYGVLADLISSSLGARSVRVWSYDRAAGAYLAIPGAAKPVFGKIPETHPLALKIKEAKGPFLLNDENPALASSALVRELSPATGAAACAPLVTDSGPFGMTGFVLVGEDISGQPYTDDDLDLLRAFASHAAAEIRNIVQSNEILSAREARAFHAVSSFVIHDLKNCANSLSLVSQNARLNISSPEFQKDAIRAVDSTVERMKALMERLASAPRNIELKKEAVDIAAVLLGVFRKIKPMTGRSITLNMTGGPAPLVEADPAAMETVFSNLLSNACEAISGDGEISVRTGTAGGFLNITVSDSGPGIPREFMEGSLFKPFRTTKKHGFGIGLFQCRAIMEAHGGSMEAESVEGRGASFTLTLPLAETKAMGRLYAWENRNSL